MKDEKLKRKIVKDRNYPGSEQINKHQNFDELQKGHAVAKQMMVKKMLLWSGAIVTAAGITGAVMMNNNKENNSVAATTETIQETKVEACVQPPIPGAEMPFTIYKISSKDGGVIEYPSGSKITIPANAFVNADGTAVGDTVEIKYREYHDALDIFLSGIPMHYDSAGTKRILESAGMLEILAFDNGKSLRLKEESGIQISMASYNDEERFNLYELDTITKNWIYKGKDKVEQVAVGSKQLAGDSRQKAVGSKQENEQLIQPAIADPQKYSFKIRYEKKDFPELAAYENVLFEVTDNNFKPAYYKINWNKISLYSDDVPGHYIIKLKKADTTISVTAKPVFDKANYESARLYFEEQHKQASVDRDAKEFEERKTLNAINKSVLGNNSRKLMLNAKQMIEAYRSFTVQNLGTHNADFPMLPLYQFAYNIRKQEEAAKNNTDYSTIFLVEQGKNTVFRFAKGEPVNCNPKAKNLMWTVTSGGQIAFFRIADYTKLKNGDINKINPEVAKDQDLAFNEIKKFNEVGL